MKKATMCIGVFIVLFLAVGVYMVQAEVTSGLNGTWLKFTGSLKGMEFVEGPGSEEAGRNDNDSIKLYGCAVDGPFFDNQFFVQFYEKASTATPAGVGVFEKKAGTADKFAGWLNMRLMEDYDPAAPDTYTDNISVPGEMTIKRNNLDNINKINFKGFGGHGEKRPTNPQGPYTGYALYGVKKLNGQSATAKSLPFDENTACPAGYVIQVKKTDDGVHTGTIDPPGPWVPVAAGVSQAFTITTAVDCTTVSVWLDNNTGVPDYIHPCVTPPGAVNFNPVTISPGANHSILVQFD
ncbi:MAG: hypothetical protein H6Q54_1160 [Deltaproteobacteria bacterium]|nr:hypothetical protein [Deltaproteobacteria bacterium]